MKLRSTTWRFIRQTAGAAAAEFALVTPFLLCGFIGAADYGRAVFTAMEMRSAAEAGVRYASVNGYDSESMITAAQSASTLSIPSNTITPSSFYACVTETGSSSVIGTTQSSSFTCSDGKTISGKYAEVQITSSFTTIFAGDQASAPTTTATVRIT